VKSIRVFLIGALLSSITLVIFIASLRGYQSSMSELQQLFDDLLQQQVGLLTQYAMLHQSVSVAGNTAGLPPSFDTDPAAAAESVLLYQVWHADRRAVMRSANAPTAPLLEFEEGYYGVNYQGYRWRALVTRDNESGLWMMVADRDDLRYQIADRVVISVLTPIVIGLPVLGLVIWWIVSFGLQPIYRLATEVGSKEASDLTSIALEKVPAELGQLATSINELLRRLEASFHREKRFAADAAHELRTPIAAIRVHLHNLRNELHAPGGTLARLEEGVERLSHLVEQTLVLNRLAPDQYMANFTGIDLQQIARQVITGVYADIEAKQQGIELKGVACEIQGDAFGIEMLILNLVNNAIKYTPAGGQIAVGVFKQDNRAVLEVMDSGPGIPASEQQRVFERFYRVGGDRHNSGVSGCGLGLSIVQRIVELHGAELALGVGLYGNGLKVTVRFPLHSRPAVHRRASEFA
jgi:two-component system sensor histidine kinase QseC